MWCGRSINITGIALALPDTPKHARFVSYPNDKELAQMLHELTTSTSGLPAQLSSSLQRSTMSWGPAVMTSDHASSQTVTGVVNFAYEDWRRAAAAVCLPSFR